MYDWSNIQMYYLLNCCVNVMVNGELECQLRNRGRRLENVSRTLRGRREVRSQERR